MKNKTVNRIFIYIGRYKPLFFLTLLFSAATVGMTLAVPVLFGKAVDCIITENKVDFYLLKTIFLKIIILVCLTGVTQWVMDVINNKITNAVTKSVRNDFFNKLQTVPLKYLDENPSGEILSKLIGDVDQFADGLLMGFTQFFTGILTVAGTLSIMFVINWVIALVVAVITPVSLFAAKFISKKTYVLFKKQSEIRGEQTAFTDESVTNVKTAQAYCREEKNLDKFREINGRLIDCSLKATFFSSLSNPVTRFVNAIVYAGVALSGALIAVTGSFGLAVTAGSLTGLLAYANKYTKPFNDISSVITELQNALACAAGIFGVIDEKSEMKDKPDAAELKNAQGNIRLENVCFSYVPERKLIENFNLSAKSGEKIAIVGPTGCGKTTLINLLMRFYDVNSGKIFVDGYEIRDITRKSLRKVYGMVLQDTWLKTASVKENVSFGKQNATDEEIEEACRLSRADGFIRQLSDGYDTVISDDGTLSQGQKQLLCIARVMLVKPDMLILDEATSSIDTRTELKIQEAFDILMENRTSFVVAHRLSTIESADIILVMENGNIIEQGSHKELLEKRGFYYNLYNSRLEE